MRKRIITTDNHSTELDQQARELHGEALQLLAAKPLCKLDLDEHPNLLIFPQEFNTHGDDIGKEHIFSLNGNSLVTGNIMGFVGYRDTQVSIRSRFAHQDGKDYFLHYMLQRVFAVNLFNLKYDSDTESIFDFLIYLFPSFLKRAMKQGLYKEYQTRRYNDANVRGRIDIGRHIRQNIPFAGRVAYTTREYAFDNHVTQLIRHTIEYIATHPFCGNILDNDDETKELVSQIRQATMTYNRNERRQVMNQNIRPIHHPYYGEYRNLQRLCMQILRHEEMKYGRDDEQIYGILFDGAWLWEEYLYTFMSSYGFKHPQNKIGSGGKRIFIDNIGHESVMPDFHKSGIVLDAKYKGYSSWSAVSREDRFQLLAYMHLYCATHSGFIVPIGNAIELKTTRHLNGRGGTMSLFGMNISIGCKDFKDFISRITKEECLLNDRIGNLYQP